MSEVETVLNFIFGLIIGFWLMYEFLIQRKRQQQDLDLFCTMQKTYHLLLEQAVSERDRAILDCQAARLDRERAILERDITRAQLRVCSEQLRVYSHALNAEQGEPSPPPS